MSTRTNPGSLLHIGRSPAKCATGCGRPATTTATLRVRPANAPRSAEFTPQTRPVCDECAKWAEGERELALGDVDLLFRSGRLTEAQVETYLAAWNSPVHFSHAFLWNGAIRQHNPDEFESVNCKACRKEAKP